MVSVRSSTVKKAILRIVRVTTAATAAVVTVGLTNGSLIHAQPPKTAARPSFRLPDEAAGIDGIVQTLISVFDQADIIGLGEAHGRRADSDLRITLVRHPDFAKKVRNINELKFSAAT